MRASLCALGEELARRLVGTSFERHSRNRQFQLGPVHNRGGPNALDGILGAGLVLRASCRGSLAPLAAAIQTENLLIATPTVAVLVAIAVHSLPDAVR
jgi:hypothetical protein